MPTFTLQYVYELSDFDTSGSLIAPPDEQGAQAQGNPPFNLALLSGSTPQQLVVNDNDQTLDEIGDPGQVLDAPITLDGVTYPAGTRVVVNYRLTDANGFDGYSITLGSGNSGNNDTTAFVTNGPMVPGQTYTFIQESNIGSNPVPAEEFACFTAGTLIKTAKGEIPIEQLEIGDRVMTCDNGFQSVRWIGMRTIQATGKMAPIEIAEGTLGCTQTTRVSPNHRILITGAEAQLYFGEAEVLVSAKSLVNHRTIRRITGGDVTYVHVMFDNHELIWGDGCLSESFYVGDRAMDTLDDPQTEEILTIFPELAMGTCPQSLARPEAKAYLGAVIGTYL